MRREYSVPHIRPKFNITEEELKDIKPEKSNFFPTSQLFLNI